MNTINLAKADYIKEMLNRNMREDSRALMDFRDISIDTGILKNAEGSAQVDLGNTRVLCGVKLQPEETMKDTPDQGNLVVSAELLPLASKDYESGPPSPDAIELARVVDRGIRAGQCVDLKDLFIEDGKAWTIFVDIYILNFDGNLFDASYMAAMAALSSAWVPKYENDAAVMEERIRKLKVNNIVTPTTFAKIGQKIVLDPDANEEAAMAARLTIAVDKDFIRAMQKGLSGGFTQKEIQDMIDMAFEKHAMLKDYISAAPKE
ncbi:MAG: exosome complex protein Rrp42 [Candidatus Marsarchaeota archaeon]|nr:exosome complex protein Rrp42 [Candidatus Marsarchaeota archaeon]MCL5106474.1 exosome complex protein Rrp42 [Candidatus Marsarchaeota archaeon]